MKAPQTMKMIWGGQKDGVRNPCAACGRELKGENFFVHVIDGGSNVLHPDEEKTYQPDAGEMGFHPVGPECRKKFGAFAVKEAR